MNRYHWHNLVLGVVVALSLFAVHFLGGVAWSRLGLYLGGAVVLGLALGVLAAWDLRRRDPWRVFLRGHEKAEREAAKTRHPTSRPALGESA